MRIQVHDFAGHPFQAELSRELAARGHVVEHVYSTQYASGKGNLTTGDGDPETLRFTGLQAPRGFAKYDPVGRVRFELAYARAWRDHLAADPPDCVVACNVPLFVLERFHRMARRRALPWVLWHQDLFSRAIAEEIGRRLPSAAQGAATRVVGHLERNTVATADRVVAIGDAFVDAYRDWGLRTGHVAVIPNWAPVDEITPQPRDNGWSRRHLPADGELRLLYAGTLGRKHNPLVLVALLEQALDAGVPARLVVASEGDGIEALRTLAQERPDLPITLLPFQAATDLPAMLGSADVHLAVLEPGASRFSIPSKVLSSLAAGRPILGLMPSDNPAAADIEGIGGLVAPPTDDGARSAAAWLRDLAADPGRVADVGRRARALAVERFGIGSITDRFEQVIREAVAGAPSRGGHEDLEVAR